MGLALVICEPNKGLVVDHARQPGTCTMDGIGHVHAAIEVRIVGVGCPAGSDQLGPDTERDAREQFFQRRLDRFGAIIERAAIFVVVGLDVEEDVVDDVLGVADWICTEPDAARCELSGGAAEAGRDHLGAGLEEGIFVDLAGVVTSLDEWHCHSFHGVRLSGDSRLSEVIII